jgi:hypothetical protein
VVRRGCGRAGGIPGVAACRQTLHQFIEARVADLNPDDPARATNSGNNRYALSEAALEVIRCYSTAEFDSAVRKFADRHGSLADAYRRSRTMLRVPLTLPGGATISLSAGEHNVLQKAIVEEFGPRFAPGAAVLYVGDTAKKHIVVDHAVLARLSIPITEHDKLPDIVMYIALKKWLFMIEAVTSHGPMTPVRLRQLQDMLAECRSGMIYVTAFLNRDEFRRHVADIAWETEVWIAEDPDHLIHFDGHRFLGPYRTELTAQ